MSLRLVIPTHQRTHRQVTLKNLWPANDVLVVTSTAHEASTLRELHPGLEVIVAKPASAGIAAKRHWIMKNVVADCVFMLDDDMDFFARTRNREFVDGAWKVTNGDEKLLHPARQKDLKPVFRAMEGVLKRGDYGMIGLGSRMNNVYEPKTWVENTRQMHAFGVMRAPYLKHKLDFGEIALREDFNIALRLLRLGYRNALYVDTVCSPRAYGAAGGTSGERTTAISDAGAVQLAAMHPGLVRVVERGYKNNARKEVVVSWKKAYRHER